MNPEQRRPCRMGTPARPLLVFAIRSSPHEDKGVRNEWHCRAGFSCGRRGAGGRTREGRCWWWCRLSILRAERDLGRGDETGWVSLSPSMRPFLDAADKLDQGGSQVFDTEGPRRGQIVGTREAVAVAGRRSALPRGADRRADAAGLRRGGGLVRRVRRRRERGRDGIVDTRGVTLWAITSLLDHRVDTHADLAA